MNYSTRSCSNLYRNHHQHHYHQRHPHYQPHHHHHHQRHYHNLHMATNAMDRPLPPLESGRFVAARSQDVFVDVEGVHRAAEMLYALRHSEELTASGWKKANPLAPRDTADQGSV
ncbi:unnamed protein product [Arctogadus glacialis]